MRARPSLGLLRVMALAATTSIAPGCSGPPAPDAAICRDVIHRLCLPVRCPVVTATFAVGDPCELDLRARSGCGQDDFTFQEPLTRDRVLECRLVLLRAGLEMQQHPDCEDVAEMIEQCPDVTAFLGGQP